MVAWGGSSARAGFSNGTRQPGTFFEIAGSAVNGALLDNNNVTGLIHNALNSNIPGRYLFQVRSGHVIQADLQITKTASSTLVNRDNNFTYTLTVRNNGPSGRC